VPLVQLIDADAARDAKILKQVEFYFSDSNFPKDKFLKAQAALNADGNVPIATIATFERMKKIGGTLEDVVRVMRSSDQLEVTEDGKYVRRKDPLPENDVTLPRSIYAKGFPIETTTMEDVEAFFAPHGDVLCVRLRRIAATKAFKGSAFVEFKTAEAAQQVAAKELKFTDDAAEPLIIKLKSDYLKSKIEARKEKLQKRKADKISAKDESKDGEGKKDDEADADNDEADEDEPFELGRILKLSGIGADVSREDIKAALEGFGVEFIDFKRGVDEGHVRFEKEGEASRAAAKLAENKTELGGKVPTIAVLEGEVEAQYWKVIKEAQKDKKKGSKGGKGKGKGGKGKVSCNERWL